MGIASFIILLYESLVPNHDLVTAHEWLLCIEFAHILLFFLAIFFVIHAFFLMGVSIFATKKFIRFFHRSYHDILQSYNNMNSSQKFIFKNIPFSSFREEVEFKILHSLFRDTYCQIPYDFDFSLYLQKCFQKYAMRTSEVSIYSWLAVIVVIIANYFRAQYGGPFSCAHDSVLKISRTLSDQVAVSLLSGTGSSTSSEGEEVASIECSYQYTYLFLIMALFIVAFVMVLAGVGRIYVNRLLHRTGVRNSNDYKSFIEFCEEDYRFQNQARSRKGSQRGSQEYEKYREELARSEPFRWSGEVAIKNIDKYFDDHEHIDEEKILYVWVTDAFSSVCEILLFQLYWCIAQIKLLLQQSQTTQEQRLRSHGGDLLRESSKLSEKHGTETAAISEAKKSDNLENVDHFSSEMLESHHKSRSNSIFSSSGRSPSIAPKLPTRSSFRLSMKSSRLSVAPNEDVIDGASSIVPSTTPTNNFDGNQHKLSGVLFQQGTEVVKHAANAVGGALTTVTHLKEKSSPKPNESHIDSLAINNTNTPTSTRRKSFLSFVEHDIGKNIESDIKKMLVDDNVLSESDDSVRKKMSWKASGRRGSATVFGALSLDQLKQVGGSGSTMNRERTQSNKEDDESDVNAVGSVSGDGLDVGDIVHTTMTSRFIASLPPLPASDHIEEDSKPQTSFFARIHRYYTHFWRNPTVRPHVEDGLLSDNFVNIFHFGNVHIFYRYQKCNLINTSCCIISCIFFNCYFINI